MPVIQDPRMNSKAEARFGVAYFEEDFSIDDVSYQSGHYFYKKASGNPNEPFNSRYLPQGFPIKATARIEFDEQEEEGVIPPDLLEYYKKMFPNLIYTYALKVEAHPDAIKESEGTFDIDGSKPMAAYMNRHTSDGTRGLHRFNLRQQYIYNRNEDTLQTN